MQQPGLARVSIRALRAGNRLSFVIIDHQIVPYAKVLAILSLDVPPADFVVSFRDRLASVADLAEGCISGNQRSLT